MKKIQFLFALAAIMLSVVGVLANKLTVTTYYKSTSATPDCSDPLLVNPPSECELSGASPCIVEIEGDEGPIPMFVYKIVDENPCEQVQRPEPQQ